MTPQSRRFGRAALFLGICCLAFRAAGDDIYYPQPAALDQPHINVLIKTTANGAPLQDTWGFGYFNIDAYFDTGASGIMLSQETADILGLPFAVDSNTGKTVIYQDVGVGGSQDFYVSNSLYLGIAKFHPDAVVGDLTNLSAYDQTVGPVRFQITQTPALDGLDPLDVVGTPAMVGKVVVIDPKPLDTLLDRVRTYVYNPGTPFRPATADSDPGIPTTNRHVRLSYASFNQFTTVNPTGATEPTLASNPFIGPNPVAKFNGGATDSTPGVTVEFNGLKTTGSFLFDTGAAASMISSSLAANIHVRYKAGTQGTDDPVLEKLDPITQQWTSIADQFTQQLAGVGGTITAAGFYLDRLLVRSIEGNATDDSDPRHLNFYGAPVLVNDISVLDPSSNRSLTLDGVFGMNNLMLNAVVIPGFPLPSILNTTLGNFNWITFDQPNGILGLDVKPPISAWTGGAAQLSENSGMGWSDSTNWEGVSPNNATIQLVFGQSTPVTVENNNDFSAGTPFRSITFTGAAAFNLRGNSIALGGDVVNNSAQTQTISLDIEFTGAARTINTAAGDIVMNGSISGSQNLVKEGAFKLVLKADNNYTGATSVAEGVLSLDGGSISTSSPVNVAAGATLEVVSGTPTLGNISGQGSVNVSGASTSLVASSITAGTLTIGSVPLAASVPEPSALALLWAGALATIALVRRNRRR